MWLLRVELRSDRYHDTLPNSIGVIPIGIVCGVMFSGRGCRGGGCRGVNREVSRGCRGKRDRKLRKLQLSIEMYLNLLAILIQMKVYCVSRKNFRRIMSSYLKMSEDVWDVRHP